jgi:hypothetical protein
MRSAKLDNCMGWARKRDFEEGSARRGVSVREECEERSARRKV